MPSSPKYRLALPLALTAMSILAYGGLSLQPSHPLSQLASHAEDSSSQPHRRLGGLPKIILRGLLPNSVNQERRTLECLSPMAPPPLPGKKGIGMALREEGQPGSWVVNLPRVMQLNPYWNYSWNTKRWWAQPDDIEFVPMLWGAWGKETGLINKIETDIFPEIEAGRVHRVLGFNEPDVAAQSNLAVEDVVEYWQVLEDIGAPIASPSVGQGLGSWMLDFMSKVDESCLRMEYVALHWYGGASFQSFVTHMETVYQTYGSERPLLITEFAPADWNAETPEENRFSQQQVLDFMKEALPWLEATEWIAGYAWFPFEQSRAAGTSSALFDSSGNLTPLGTFYSTVTTENPVGDQSIVSNA